MNDSVDGVNSQSTGKNFEDRRSSERRSGHDQREMIRYELDKSDRRSDDDRRQSVTSWGTDDPV